MTTVVNWTPSGTNLRVTDRARLERRKQFAAAKAQIPPPAHPRLRAVGVERLATLVGGGFRLTLVAIIHFRHTYRYSILA